MYITEKIEKYLNEAKEFQFTSQEKAALKKIGKQLDMPPSFGPYKERGMLGGEAATFEINDDMNADVTKMQYKDGKIEYNVSYYSHYEDGQDYWSDKFNPKEIYDELEAIQDEYQYKGSPFDDDEPEEY